MERKMKMVLYAVCLFVCAALQVLTGVLTYMGRHDLVYDYYISGVNDLQGYTKAMGFITMALAAPSLICGVLFLLEPVVLLAVIGVVVLIGGIVGGYVASNNVQKKYNGGMF